MLFGDSFLFFTKENLTSLNSRQCSLIGAGPNRLRAVCFLLVSSAFLYFSLGPIIGAPRTVCIRMSCYHAQLLSLSLSVYINIFMYIYPSLFYPGKSFFFYLPLSFLHLLRSRSEARDWAVELCNVFFSPFFFFRNPEFQTRPTCPRKSFVEM